MEDNHEWDLSDYRFHLAIVPKRRVYCEKTGIVYELGDQIGSGAAAVVHKCRRVYPVHVNDQSEKKCDEVVSDEELAAKILDLKVLRLAQDYEHEKKKILREVDILSQLHHPCIVDLLQVIETPSELFLIMDLVKGGELFYKIVELGSINEDQARYIVLQILSALHYMHTKGVIHRDLKLENILIADEKPGGLFQIRIADFGLAKDVLQGLSKAKTFVGTPQYWAPEVIKCRHAKDGSNITYGPEVDLWSLGCVIYVLLGGAYPFQSGAKHIEETIKQGNYNFNHSRFRKVSETAKNLIQGLLSVDPRSRLTINQVLNHPWMSNYKIPISLSYINDDLLMNVKPYNLAPKKKHAQLLSNDSVMPLLVMNDSAQVKVAPGLEKVFSRPPTLPWRNHSICATEQNAMISIYPKRFDPELFQKQHGKTDHTSNYSPTCMNQPRSNQWNSQESSESSDEARKVFEFRDLFQLQISLLNRLHKASLSLRHSPGAASQLMHKISEAYHLQCGSVHLVTQFESTCASILCTLADLTLAASECEIELALSIFEEIREWVTDLKNHIQMHQNNLTYFAKNMIELMDYIYQLKRNTDNSIMMMERHFQQTKQPLLQLTHENMKNMEKQNNGSLGTPTEGSNCSSFQTLDPITKSSRETSMSNIISTKEIVNDSVINDSNKLNLTYLSLHEPSGSSSSSSQSPLPNTSRISRSLEDIHSHTPYHRETLERKSHQPSDLTDEVYDQVSSHSDACSDFIYNKNKKPIKNLFHLQKSFYNSSQVHFETFRNQTFKKLKALTSQVGEKSENLEKGNFEPDTQSGSMSSLDFHDVTNIPDNSEASKITPDFIQTTMRSSIDASAYSVAKELLDLLFMSPLCTNSDRKQLLDKAHQFDDFSSRIPAYDSSQNTFESEPGIPSSLPQPPKNRHTSSTSKQRDFYRHQGQYCLNEAFRSSELLIKVLDDIRRIDTILRKTALFWMNLSSIVEQLCRMKGHAKRLLQYTVKSSTFRTEFFHQVQAYRQFWSTLKDEASAYIKAFNKQSPILENFASTIANIADRVDTVSVANRFSNYA